MKQKIDIVVPVYGSPGSLRPLVESVRAALDANKYDLEILLVNDRCPRGSGAVVRELAASFDFVTGVDLVRNFGQHSAIAAGLSLSSGDWVVVMDCDLQDNPACINDFLKEAELKKCDVVLARRTERKVGFFKRLQSSLFHKVMNSVVGFRTHSTVGNFGLYSKRVIQSLHLMGDKSRPFPFLVQWLGYPTGFVDVVQEERFEGKSSYTLSKLVQLALDIAVGFSDRPLKIAVFSGFFVSLGAVVFALFFIARYFILAIVPSGWTSLIVTMFMSLGAILFTLGIVGLYVGKNFEQAKNRPTFLIDEVFKNRV
ncbi:MAG TPA: glycosyltransferase family 2 protein [Bdellovibrio sp.]